VKVILDDIRRALVDEGVDPKAVHRPLSRFQEVTPRDQMCIASADGGF
jgi:hypothetical protein